MHVIEKGDVTANDTANERWNWTQVAILLWMKRMLKFSYFHQPFYKL